MSNNYNKEKKIIDGIMMKNYKQTEADKRFGMWFGFVLAFIGGFLGDILECLRVGIVKTIKNDTQAVTKIERFKSWATFNKHTNFKLFIPFLLTLILSITSYILTKNETLNNTNLVVIGAVILPVIFLFGVGFFDITKPFRLQNKLFVLVCVLDIVFLYTEDRYKYFPQASIYENFWVILVKVLLLFSPIVYIAIHAYMQIDKEPDKAPYEDEFNQIGLKTKSKNGKVPYLIDTYQMDHDDKKIYIFKTLIPISEFEKKVEYLENILQENIVNIKGEHGIVKLITGKKEEKVIRFEEEFSQIGLKTKGEFGTVPLLRREYEEQNLIGGGHYVWEFETLLKKQDFVDRKEELEKILVEDNDKVIGIENEKKIMRVYVGEEVQVKLDWLEEYNKKHDTKLKLGMDALLKRYIEIDIHDRHILMGGSSGSGKSVMLRLLTWLFYLKGYKLYMSDFKDGAEFNQFCARIGDITTTRQGFYNYLVELNQEASKRNKLFGMSATNDIEGYNKIVENPKMRLKRIVLVCDELASPLDLVGADSNTKALVNDIKLQLAELARKGRNAGIHMVLCMQRPDADILQGQIKNNLLIRICGRVKEASLSSIVLGNNLAKNLPKLNGRMILDSDEYDNLEIQSFFFDLNKELMKQGIIESTELAIFEKEQKEKEKKKLEETAQGTTKITADTLTVNNTNTSDDIVLNKINLFDFDDEE